jgi:hypothetical protein
MTLVRGISRYVEQSLNIFRQPFRQWNQLYTLLAAKLRSRLPAASGAKPFLFQIYCMVENK